MRSNYLAKFRQQLSELNDCFSHYIFVWVQFYIDNDEKLKSKNNYLTTQVYPNNLNSRQFNVTLGHLSNSHNQTQEFILKSFFLLAYSQFEVYMRTFYEFARRADNSLPSLTVSARIPDDIFSNLNFSKNDCFDGKEIWTFDYMRLRRNRLTHTGGESKGDLAELIRQRGNSLQKYWQKKLRKGLFGLNFQSNETEIFVKEEIFDLINIWRLLTNKLDKVICEKIGMDSIIDTLKNNFEKENKPKLGMWGIQKSKRKFRNYCKITFNIILDENKLKEMSFLSDVA